MAEGHGYPLLYFINSLVCPSRYQPTVLGPRPNKTFFFLFLFRPFPACCPGLKRGGFFFPRPFPAGCQRLIRPLSFLFSFFSPFSGGLPRVNTRVFVFPPFSGGLPRVNTRVFFSRPCPAGCPGLIPWFFFFFPRN